MSFDSFLEKVKKFEVRPYNKKDTLSLTHVPFSGAPRRHPFEGDKLALVVDPFSTNTCYFEFSIADVEYVEKLPSLATPDGESIPMARVWVRKGSLAVRSTPFVVEDTSSRLAGSWPSWDPQD